MFTDVTINMKHPTIPLTAAVVLSTIGAALQAQTSVVLFPTEDASIGYHDGYPSASTNYNSAVHYSGFAQPGTIGGTNAGRGIMDFDLSVIPSGSTILGAFLSLSALGPWAATGEVATVGHVGENSCTLRRITSAWSDNTVTWNTQPTNTSQNAVALAQSSYTMQNYLNINVTALVQDMVDDPNNSFGFMLMLDNESTTRGLIFHSSETTEPDKQPALLIIYGDCDGIGMAEQGDETGVFTVSPSICRSGATVLLDGAQDPGFIGSLSLYEQAGRLVHAEPISRWPYQFVVPALAEGVYTMSISGQRGERMDAVRLVVQ